MAVSFLFGAARPPCRPPKEGRRFAVLNTVRCLGLFRSLEEAVTFARTKVAPCDAVITYGAHVVGILFGSGVFLSNDNPDDDVVPDHIADR